VLLTVKGICITKCHTFAAQTHKCCSCGHTDENWDEWQQPAREQLEAEYTEEQTEDREPHCDDPDFIVRTVTVPLNYTVVIPQPLSHHQCSLCQCFDTAV